MWKVELYLTEFAMSDESGEPKENIKPCTPLNACTHRGNGKEGPGSPGGEMGTDLA